MGEKNAAVTEVRTASVERCRKFTLIAVGVLVGVAAVAVVLDSRAGKGRRLEAVKIFQRGTGGLGLGAIATPIWQFLNYDARVLSVDDSITWPVPGGYSFGPDRTATVSYFEEVPGNQWDMAGDETP